MVAPDLPEHAYLNAVTSDGADDVWAVGETRKSYQTVITHWDGDQWSLVASPNPGGESGNYLDGVIAFSAKNAWAVGGYEPAKALLTHWNGTDWTKL